MIRPQTLRDIAMLGCVATLVGIINVRSRETPLAWIAAAKPLETSCSAPPTPVPDHLRVSVAEAQAWIDRDDVTWVDARSGAHFAKGHLPGAISLPIESAIDMLPVQSLPIAPDQLVVTYCDGGPCELSEALAHLLAEQAGCSRVRVLDGGFQAWKAANLPTVTTSSATPSPDPLTSPSAAVASLKDEANVEETPR